MPNTVTNILPQTFAQALQTLREFCVMPRLVNLDFANTPANIGDTINLRLPQPLSAADVSPTAAPVTPTDLTFTRTSVTLNRWRRAGFYLTDKERGEIGEGITPMQMQEAIKALANDINAFILLQGKDVFRSVGTPGTDVFNGATWNAATTVLRQALEAASRNLVPESDRRLVLHPVSYASALGVDGFVLAQNRGGTQTMAEKAIGRLMGMDWYEDQAIPGHTSTAFSAGAVTVNGVNAAGATTISINKLTNTTPLVRGDIITIATGPAAGQYAVAADVTLTVGNTTVTLTSPLRGATAGGEAVSLLAQQNRVNLLFHRDAFAFASRPLTSAVPSQTQMSVADPVSGVSIRMELIRQNKQDYIEFDVLYGARCIRPELAVRICD